MAKTITIGIDFGTTYSFVGFWKGEHAFPLIPSRERYGIPSVFYYDGKQILVGRMAEERAQNNPENAVTSVKRVLNEREISRGGRAFTPKEIVRTIIEYVVRCAESELEVQYMAEYDELEAVISVPVDFTVPEITLIRQAASEVTLASGKLFRVSGTIQEPCAAAIAYFGISGKCGSDVLVYDLGGGTFDVALVHANEGPNQEPYEVIDMGGNKNLGGDDWDKALGDWVIQQYEKDTGKILPNPVQKEVYRKARRWKEELTDMPMTTISISDMRTSYEKEITREEFDRLTEELLMQTIKELEKLLERQKERNIKVLVLTGGSTYMPQVKRKLLEKGILPEKMEVRQFEPEHAIAYGSARYADALSRWPRSSGPVKLIAPHSYGIVYRVREFGNRQMIKLLIRKGDALPARVENTSVKLEGGLQSLYTVCESDIDDSRTYIEEYEGHEIAALELTRPAVVPSGTRATQVMSLGEDMELHIEAYDEVQHIKVENKIKLSMIGVNL